MTIMHRRIRLILLTVVIAITALLLAASITVYSLLQPKRITDMLRDQARQAGLTLVLGAPAEPTLWPEPALVLHSLTLSSSNRPVLVAVRARVVLPWRTLLGGPPTITRLELDAPRLHLDQLTRVFGDTNPDHDESPSLPHINAGVLISHGSIVHKGKVMLDGLELETGPLLPGHVFNLMLTASAYGKPFKFSLLATPHERPDAIELDNIHLIVDVDSTSGLTMDGKAAWKGGADVGLSLAGTLHREDGRTYQTALVLPSPQADRPKTFRLTLEGPGLNADLDLPPSGLVDWWQDVSRPDTTADLPLPPLDGTLDAEQLDIGDTRIEGLHLSSGDDAVPAPASSAPADAGDTVTTSP